MNDYVKITVFSLLLAGMVIVGVHMVFSQEKGTASIPEEVVVPSVAVPTPATKFVSGTIASIDMDNSILVVRYLSDAENQNYDYVTIKVNDSTSIEKSNTFAALVDLSVGDDIAVEYKTDDSGIEAAVSIISKGPAAPVEPAPAEIPAEEAPAAIPGQ